MMDLKKLLALGLVSMMGMVACDVEEDDAAAGDAGLDCGDAGAPVCLPGEGDAGEVCACPGGEGGAGGEGGGGAVGGAGGAPEPPAANATAEWTDAKTLVLTITEAADFGPYSFGFAETGNGMDGWDGEDCIAGTKDDYDICHPVPEDGKLTLTSIHPGAEVMGDGLDALEEGATTLMHKALDGGITYVLVRQGDDENCWTWGHNTQHYIDELGCNTLSN